MRKRVWLTGLALGAVAGTWPSRSRREAPPAQPAFDPAAVARLEVAGWRAYYARNPFAALAILWRLARGELALPPRGAFRASYYAMRAQIAFAGQRGTATRALPWLTRFYAAAPRRAGVRPAALARAEADYWAAHRRVARQADQTALVDALAALHALLFGGSQAAMRPSAEARALACQAVDRITASATRPTPREGLRPSLREALLMPTASASLACPRRCSTTTD